MLSYTICKYTKLEKFRRSVEQMKIDTYRIEEYRGTNDCATRATPIERFERAKEASERHVWHEVV